MQVDVGQGILAAAVLVGEADVVEVNAAVGHLFHGLLGILQVGDLIEHLTNPVDAGQGHADHDHHHGQHHQAHQQGHDVAEQAGQIAGGQAAAHNEVGAQPGHHNDAEIDRHHHGRVVEGQQALSLDEQIVQVLGGPGELLVLIVLPDKGLDHPNGGDILLDAGVQIVILFEHLVEYLQGGQHDGADHHHQEHHGDQKGQAELDIDNQAHDIAENQRQWGAYRHPDHHHEGHLHVGDVGGHPGDQAGHAELVDVGKGKSLDPVVDGLPQVCGEARRGAGGEFARQGAKDQAQEGHDNHENAVAVDHRQVALFQALIDDDGSNERQQDLHDDLQGCQPDTEQGVPFILLQLL